MRYYMNIPYVMRKCNKCGKWLVVNNFNFYKDNSGKFGLKSTCKECCKKRLKEKYDNDEEYRKSNNRKSREYYNKHKNDKEWREKENKRSREWHKEKRLNKEYRKEENARNRESRKKRMENNEYREKINKQKREKRANDNEYREKINKRKREWDKEKRINNEEYREHRREKNREWMKNNPHINFNSINKRRSKLENQGRGINREQWNECLKWFNWKCAYSGEKIQKNKSTHGRTLDHIVALDNIGLNEPWNVVPMRKGYNSSKCNRIDSLNWYMEQEYFDIERLDKIVEWQIYAYEKWGGEEFGELILITDLLED